FLRSRRARLPLQEDPGRGRRPQARGPERGPQDPLRADQARHALRDQRLRRRRPSGLLTGRPRSSLTAEVAPLAGAPDGSTSELVIQVPSDLDLVEEAVELVARHCEPDFADPRVVRFNLRVALSEALANAILYGNKSDPALQVA